MKLFTAKRVWYCIGMILCILPVCLSVIEYFPLWTKQGAVPTISSISLILLLIAFVPLKRAVAKYLQSPSAWLIWLSVLVLAVLLRSVIDSIINIAAIAFPSNLLGAVCFKISGNIGDSE